VSDIGVIYIYTSAYCLHIRLYVSHACMAYNGFQPYAQFIIIHSMARMFSSTSMTAPTLPGMSASVAGLGGYSGASSPAAAQPPPPAAGTNDRRRGNTGRKGAGTVAAGRTGATEAPATPATGAPATGAAAAGSPQTMKAQSPLEKGKQLMAALGKDLRTASGYKIELRGLEVSEQLCGQLDQVCTALESSFTKLQGCIKQKLNKDDDYKEVIKDVIAARTAFAERAGYAKAIIQANGMKAKPTKKATPASSSAEPASGP